MQVAVPRVEHVAHDQLMGGGDTADGLEHVGERGARHHGVLHQQIAGGAAQGPGRFFAAPPQAPPPLPGGGGAGAPRPPGAGQLLRPPPGASGGRPPRCAPTRSGPHGSPPGLPSSTTAPVASTTSSASTWFAVTPYFRQCGPPEFSATLPPSVHAVWLEGSGA